jgi:hypothetical protein
MLLMNRPGISLFFGLLISGNISNAQNRILAGKIVDQNGKHAWIFWPESKGNN